MGPYFLLTKSHSVIPGVAAPRDFLKVFLESELEVESDSYKFYLRIDFELLSIQF